MHPVLGSLVGGIALLPKKAWKNHGVSEVIGTILILLMTVVLFSVVIIWVNGFPAPLASNRLDMEARVVPQYSGGVWNGMQILLTHRGGEDLRPDTIRIYRTVNGSTEVLGLEGKNFDGDGIHNYTISGEDARWNIGETWSYVNHSIPQTARVSIIIADIIRSSVLWEQDIYGVAGVQPPLFFEKWTDSAPGSPSRDPVQPGDTFNLYAKVHDPDGDLDITSVKATFTFVGGSPTLRMWDDGPFGGHGDAITGDGVFTLAWTTQAPQSWDGGIIIMMAKDLGGRETRSRFVLSVVDLGTTNVFNNGSTSTGPLNLTKFNDLQRYDLFNKSEWDSKGWSATPTRRFKQGETVVVVIASQYLKDVQLSNGFTVYDTTGGSQVELVYGGGAPGPSTHPSSNSAFTPAGSVLNYNIYIYSFSTRASDYGFGGGQMVVGRYPFTFDLKSAFATPPKNRFSANDEFVVTDASGLAPSYPSVATYSDAAHTRPSTTFIFYSTVYVKITVRDTDPSFTIGGVEIRDYIGGIQVLAAPGSSPVSAAQINGTTTYKLSVDLSRPNRDPWVYGNNTYTMTIQGVIDSTPVPTGEYYNALATQIKILGPRWALDALIGTIAQQHQNFGDTIYGRFYANSLAWGTQDLETFPAAPGSGAPNNPITAMVFGDMDGDSFLDIAAGQDEEQPGNKVTGKVEWWENTNGVGYPLGGGPNPWVKHVIDTLCTAATTSPCITSIAVGHIDRDSKLDIVAATSTGDIWWYANDGIWTARFVANVGNRVNAVKAADLNGDKIADLVVAINTGTNSGRVYINDGTGVFGTTTQTMPGCCLMVADTPGGQTGTLTNTYTATQTSNDVRQELREARANHTLPGGEILGTQETDVGTYVQVQNLDGNLQTLTEGAVGTRFSLDGGVDGHRYGFTNVWAEALDRIEIHIYAGITVGCNPLTGACNEAFRIRTSTSPAGPWTDRGSIFARPLGEYVYAFTPGVALNGVTVYVSIMDMDQSASDGATDGVLSTLAIDQLYLLIQRPSTGTTSAATKVWTTQLVTVGQDAYKFFVEGFHTSNNENDNFIFRYGTTANGPFFDLLTVNNIDTDLITSVSMDRSVGGRTIYILVEDTDHTAGSITLDTIRVDHMYINGYKATPVSYNLATGLLIANSIAVANIDADTHGADIVLGFAGAANRIQVYWNNGNGQTYSGPDVLPTGAGVNSVDVGYISGSPGAPQPDARLDAAVSLTNNRILNFAFGGVRGSWSTSTIHDLSTTQAVKIRVGDVDGDYWDDLVLFTSDHYVFYIHNERGTGFTQSTIDYVASTIRDIDIGDVDRGILATYATL